MFGGRKNQSCNAAALEAARKAIETQEDFVKFAGLLLQNLKKHPKEWENGKLVDFLEALSAFSKDVGGFYQTNGEQKDLGTPDWSVFATLLLGAKVYE